MGGRLSDGKLKEDSWLEGRNFFQTGESKKTPSQKIEICLWTENRKRQVNFVPDSWLSSCPWNPPDTQWPKSGEICIASGEEENCATPRGLSRNGSFKIVKVKGNLIFKFPWTWSINSRVVKKNKHLAPLAKTKSRRIQK